MVLKVALQGSGTNPRIQFEASDHGDVILAGLTKLRDMEKLFDVVFLVENERLPAHRVILASCSEYFRAMFTDGLLECRQDEVHMSGVTANGMRSLIEFAYSSKLLIDADNIEDVLNAANHIQILPVVEACVNYLQSQMNPTNCVDILTVAEMFSLDNLATFTYKYISRNFMVLSVCPQFMNLSSKQFRKLLQFNYPVDCSEAEILSAVVSRVTHHQCSVSEILSFFEHIHFNNISIEELENLHNCSVFYKLLANEEYGSQLRPFMRDVYCALNDKVSGLVNTRGYEKSLIICGVFQPGHGMTNDIRYYNEESRKLQQLTAVPHVTPLPHVTPCDFGIVVVDNCLYVIGGCYIDLLNEEIVLDYGFKYCPQTNSWSNICPMNQARCRFFLGSVSDKLYAIGADPSVSMESVETAACECYNQEQNKWTAIAGLPGNRMQHAGATLCNIIYISGGLQDPDGPCYNSFFSYCPRQDVWTELPQMLNARADHTMFTHSDQIYVVGGWLEDLGADHRTMVDAIDCFHRHTNQWTTVHDVDSPARLYATYTVHNDRLYLVGGWLKGDYQQERRTVKSLDLSFLEEWSEDTELCEIWGHTSCCLHLPICK